MGIDNVCTATMLFSTVVPLLLLKEAKLHRAINLLCSIQCYFPLKNIEFVALDW